MKTVIKCVDGSVQIMTLVAGADFATAINKWKTAHPEKYLSHREMPDDVIPTDRAFRDAWADTTPELTIDIDMAKAREIHKDMLRALRKPKLEALDVEYQRADEKGDATAKAVIAAKKQSLRDVPQDPRIAATVTPDELKAVIPDVLK